MKTRVEEPVSSDYNGYPEATMPITFTEVDLPFGWLGNMVRFPVKYGGKWWKTTEALFQALR